MSRLISIQLEGFRSIRKLPCLTLNAGLNVLIGGNGAGKSNFIGFFQMLGHMMNSGLQNYIAERGGADAFLFRGVQETRELSADVDFGNSRYSMTLRAAADGRLFFARETLPKVFSKYEKGTGHFESRLLGLAWPIDMESGVAFPADCPRVYHFQNTSRTTALMRPQNAVDNGLLWSDAGNIAAFLLSLRTEHEKYYQRIVAHIRQAAPYFGDFHLKADVSGQVQLLWTERYSPKLYYPHQLSDGSIRFICLATLLLQPEPPSTIIIDEPELGLHPFAITILAGMIRLAEEKCQLIVSTQSSPLVDHLQLEDLIVVDRVEGETMLSKPNPEALKVWIEEYSVGELWDKNLIGGMPQP